MMNATHASNRSRRFRLLSAALVATALLALAVIAVSPKVAQATDFTTTQAGNWTLGTTWDVTACAGGCTAGVDYPGTGDTAAWGADNHIVTVTGAQTFSGGNFTKAGNGAPFALNSASDSLTLDSGTFTLDPSGPTVLGGSTSAKFIIAPGATLLRTGGDRDFYVDNVPGITNNGTTRFTEGGSIRLRTGAFINNDTATGGNGTALVEATGTGGSFFHHGGSGSFTNNAGGTVRADGAPLRFRYDGATFTDNGGTIEAMNGGYVSFETVAGSAVTDITTAATTTFTTDATSDIRLGGDIIALRGVITPGSDVHFGGEVLGTNNMVRSTHGGFIEFDSEVTWKGNNTNGYFNVFAGKTLEFRSPIRFDGTVGYGRIEGSPTGVLKNVAGNTFTMVASTGRLYLQSGIFENDGTIDASNLFEFVNGKFINNGLYRVSSSTVTWRSVYGSPVFENAGTVEVASGATLTVPSTITTVTQWYDSGTDALIAGTWKSAGTLNLNPTDAGGGIDTIGASATVRLSGASGSIAELSGTSLTVAGKFGVEDQQIYALTGDLTMSLGGVLEFGLEADDKVAGIGGAIKTGIDIGGNLTFNNTTIDIVEFDTLIPGIYHLISWNGTPSSGPLSLSLGNTPNNGFNYQLLTVFTGSGDIYLQVSAIPEPSTLGLALFGLFGMMRLRRRRKK